MLGVGCLEDILVDTPRGSELWQASGPGHRALVFIREVKQLKSKAWRGSEKREQSSERLGNLPKVTEHR